MDIRTINIQKYFRIPETGVLDNLTRAAITNHQLKTGRPPTGILSDDLYNEIIKGSNIMTGLSTDLSENKLPLLSYNYMPKDEYYQETTKKEYIFLHHTAGWSDPYATISQWVNDPRGKIATQYVIGGINSKTSDTKHDGKIVKTFPENGYAWHLGDVNSYMHKHSIGIEICNFGWLTQRGNNYYTYVNTMVKSDQVCDLGYTFRGYRYWHSYSSAQIASLRQLILYLADVHSIDIKRGLIERLKTMGPGAAFDYFDAAKNGEVKGLLSHTSVRKDKFDIYPHPNIISMLNSL